MFGPSFQDKRLGFEGCSVKSLIQALGVGLVLIFRFLLDLGRCGAFCVGVWDGCGLGRLVRSGVGCRPARFRVLVFGLWSRSLRVWGLRSLVLGS